MEVRNGLGSAEYRDTFHTCLQHGWERTGDKADLWSGLAQFPREGKKVLSAGNVTELSKIQEVSYINFET